jgi:hypothetical protein
MDKPKQGKSLLIYLFQLIALVLLNYIAIRFCVLRTDPDPSVSVGLLFLVPAVFVSNIVIAIILAVIKKKYSGLFFINSIIAPILFYFLFIDGVDRHQNKRYEGWKFNLHDTSFEIRLSKLDTTFDFYYRTSPGSSTGFMYGRYIANKKDNYILTTNTIEMTIKNEALFGFRDNSDSLRLTKIEN